jgi:hypothetical protein
MGMAKTVDLWAFFISQYLLPMALVPDTLWVLLAGHSSVLLPLNALVMGCLTVAFYRGLRQVEGLRGRRTFGGTPPWGLVYMLHWLPVMIATTARMCVQPKRLRWVKNCSSRRLRSASWIQSCYPSQAPAYAPLDHGPPLLRHRRQTWSLWPIKTVAIIGYGSQGHAPRPQFAR